MNIRRFLVSKTNLRNAKVVESPVPALAEGQVLLAIDSFAFTSNNVTCAAFGDAMQYWQFFPAGEAGDGQIPAWGFANVIESRWSKTAYGTAFMLAQRPRIEVIGLTSSANSVFVEKLGCYTRAVALRTAAKGPYSLTLAFARR